jgi:2-methylcitrate dehydratase PrpD
LPGEDTTMEIMDGLVEFIEGTDFHGLPAEAVKKAKEGVIDFLGCTLIGTRNPTGQIIVSHVRAFEARPLSTVIGGGFKTSPPLAALANGTLSHADDYDDISFSMPGHPSVTVLPAVLSIGEIQKISGPELLASYLVGFEVACKLGQALAPRLYQHGWHATSVLGCMGAAAAVGKLLGLTKDKLRFCLGIAGSLAAGLRANLGTNTKPLHVGVACQNGVTAALLARDGLDSNPGSLEGEVGFCRNFAGGVNPDKIIGKLGKPYDIVTPGVLFKRYPSCAETHPALDATISLAQENDIRHEDVHSIECTVTPLDNDVLVYSSPKTAVEGKFSLHFCVALGLFKRKASLGEFVDNMVSQPEVVSLMRKVSMKPDPALAEDGYTGAATIVSIKTRDGRTYTKRVDHAKGSPENPLSLEELLEKYRDCTSPILEPTAVIDSLDCLLNLDALDHIGELFSILAHTKR